MDFTVEDLNKLITQIIERCDPLLDGKQLSLITCAFASIFAKCAHDITDKENACAMAAWALDQRFKDGDVSNE